MIESLNIEQLNLHHLFQPIVRTDDQTPCGYEAFLRSEQYSNPLQLFSNARMCNQLYSLDTASIEKAVSCCHGYLKTNIFLNVFPSSLLKDSFFHLLEKLDKQYHQICSQIVLELNESNEEFDVWESNEFKDRLTELRKKNISFALDDVGAGQASLDKLIEFTPNYVKLDRFFSKDLSTNENKQKIISFFVHYCKNQSKFVLEGIETARDYETAVALGVEYVQGYFFGKPKTVHHYNSHKI